MGFHPVTTHSISAVATSMQTAADMAWVLAMRDDATSGIQCRLVRTWKWVLPSGILYEHCDS